MKQQAQVTFAIVPNAGFRMMNVTSMKSEMIHLYGNKTTFVESGDRVNVLCDGCHVAYIETVEVE